MFLTAGLQGTGHSWSLRCPQDYCQTSFVLLLLLYKTFGAWLTVLEWTLQPKYWTSRLLDFPVFCRSSLAVYCETVKHLKTRDSFHSYKNNNYVIWWSIPLKQMCFDISNNLNLNVDAKTDTRRCWILAYLSTGKACIINGHAFFFSYQWSEDKGQRQAHQGSQVCLSGTQWCLESSQPCLNRGAGSVRSVIA